MTGPYTTKIGRDLQAGHFTVTQHRDRQHRLLGIDLGGTLHLTFDAAPAECLYLTPDQARGVAAEIAVWAQRANAATEPSAVETLALFPDLEDHQ